MIIPALNVFVTATPITASPMNDNFSDIRTAFNTSAVLTDTARTVTVQHTFNPVAANPPFILGANALGQLVVGLNADKLDGLEGAAYAPVAHVHATADVTSGTFADARIAESNVTQHEAALTLVAAQIPNLAATKITSGTLADARLSANVPLLGTAQVYTALRTFEAGAAATVVAQARVTADSNPRLAIQADGKMLWGSGAAAGDTNLYRPSANKLQTDDSFHVVGTLTVIANDPAMDLNASVDIVTADPATDAPAKWYKILDGATNYYFPAWTVDGL